MEEEINIGELLIQITEENQTRKILALLNEYKNLEEAKEKVEALLNK
ncbi:MAG: protein phosphatase [Clostridiales bacterium]|nr:protein phosphatase [Clostridiales bacterium]